MWGISLAAPAKCSRCSLPWMRCMPSRPPLLTYLSGSSIRYRLSGWKFFENFFFFFLVMPCNAWELPWPRIEPVPPAVEAWSHNHWITKEILLENFKGIDFWIPTSSCWSPEAVVSWSSVVGLLSSNPLPGGLLFFLVSWNFMVFFTDGVLFSSVMSGGWWIISIWTFTVFNFDNFSYNISLMICSVTSLFRHSYYLNVKPLS